MLVACLLLFSALISDGPFIASYGCALVHLLGAVTPKT